MKKTLVALAVLAASGAAMAQSSVTLFGIVDAALTQASSAVNKKTQITGSGISSSQLGFRGTEDMGGGMAAHFWLEASLGNDNGSGGGTNTNNQASGSTAAAAGTQGLTFGRRSTISLSNAMGEIRLGRDYTPQFWNHTVYDPFGTNGVGTNQMLNSGGPITPGSTGSTYVRASNSVSFLYNHGKNATYAAGGTGFHAAVQTYYGENASNAAGNTGDDGNGSGIRVGYNQGPISVAYANSSTTYAAGNVKSSNMGGAYNFGVARVMAQSTTDKVGATLQGKGQLMGVTVPMGGGTFKLASSQYETNAAGKPTSKKMAVGYVLDLSKRTAVYGTYARVTNSGGALQALGATTGSANGSSTGTDIGVRHSF
jgi:predicted porin